MTTAVVLRLTALQRTLSAQMEQSQDHASPGLSLGEETLKLH